MANAPITQLDFDQIKTNLKEYLKGQDRFKDYNFEGSNMSVLLDILSYNTFHNNFFTNMAINEMFLDSAQLRGSVISHAKVLNYVPRSKVSSRAVVNVTLTAPDNPSFITIPPKTQFVARCGNKTYSFYTDNAYTIFPTNGSYTYFGAEIYEGTYVQEVYNVNNSGNKFIISNLNVDTSSIRVYVRESADAEEETEYVFRATVFGTTERDKVFYVQSYDEQQYQVIFGLDNFGFQPKGGAVVRIEYRITAGEEANGITSFTPAANISGYPATVSLVQASFGGLEQESIESIKFFAPKSVQVQDRAITESDYEILLKSKFPEIQAVSVYGGEELNPPRYGRVVVAVDTRNGSGISQNDISRYSAYLSQRSPIGIEPIIMTPKFMYVSVGTKVYYDTRQTSASTGVITQEVLNAILEFNDNNLNDFKSTFRTSKLQSAIDAADPFILSNDLEILPIIPLNPVLNTKNVYDITFGNSLISDQVIRVGDPINNHKPAVVSSAFTYSGSLGFIMDNGLGTLQILIRSGNEFRYLNTDIGTVDYTTGRVNIRDLNVSSYLGSEIKLYGRTVSPTVTSPKDRILSIRREDVSIEVIGVA